MGTTTAASLVETGDKRDGRGHRLATLARRAELVAEYRRSGLTMAAFARREGLAYSTFAGWVWKSDRARGSGPATALPVRFAQVQLPVTAGLTASLEVRLVDGTLVRGSTAAELALLVRALRA
jgi:transposase-like protein